MLPPASGSMYAVYLPYAAVCPGELFRGALFRQESDLSGVPYRIRTGVAAVRGRCPGPLDEGDEAA
jgi:hypothetical protein